MTSNPVPASPSPFARALMRLLDETGTYSRAQWARFLGISQSALSQWVNDRTLPRADILRMLLDFLRARGGERGVSAVAEFDAIAARPSTEVSPLSARLGETIQRYLEKSSIVEFGTQLRRLDPESQRTVLTTGSWMPVPDDSRSEDQGEVERICEKLSRCWSLFEIPHRSEILSTAVLPDRLVDARGNRCSVDALLAPPSRSVLTGSVGSGKSHLMGWLAREWAKDRHVRPVRLRPCTSQRIDDSRRTLEQVREALPNALFLFDGLDEIPAASRREAAVNIFEMARRIPAAKYVVASRPIPELKPLDEFKSFSLAPLTATEVVIAVTSAAGSCNRAGTVIDLRRFLGHLNEHRSLSRACRQPLFLKSAWSLFERNAITPFSEAEIVREYVRNLLEGDLGKQIIRVREPWASPQSLSSLVAELAFHLIASEQVTFSSSQAEAWIRARFASVPCGELLSLLSVLGIVVSRGDDHHQFAHRLLLNYFVALRAVESSDNAGVYLRDWPRRQELRDVVRLACGITNDATSLLRDILETTEADQAARCTLLAEILAQPITVERDLMERSCEMIVDWLDVTLRDWSVETLGVTKATDEEPSWALSAHGRPLESVSEQVQHALTAIHRARSGPAYLPFRQRLETTRSAVLPEFAEAMGLEGRLDVQLQSTQLRAAITEPQLV